MATRKTFLAVTIALAFCMCAVIVVSGFSIPGLSTLFGSLYASDAKDLESATRKEGDWAVTEIGRLRFRRHFAEQDRLLLVAEGKSPELWDTKQGKRVAVLKECKRAIESADASPDGKQFATGEEIGYHYRKEGEPFSRSLHIWETTTGKLVKAIEVDLSGRAARDSTDWEVSWLDRRTLLVQIYGRQNPARASFATVFVLVDVEQGKVVKMSDRLKISESLTFSPDRKRAAAGCEYGVWRGAGGGIGRGGRGRLARSVW